MALKNGTLVRADDDLRRAVDSALKQRYEEEKNPGMRRRRSTVNDAGMGVGNNQYTGGFMCSITQDRHIRVYDYDDPYGSYAGYTTRGIAFWSYNTQLSEYGHFYVWARLSPIPGIQYIRVYPVDYPIINQFNDHFVLIAEVTSTETEYSVRQIFTGDRIDDSQHHYGRFGGSFLIHGTVSGTSGNYQISLEVLGGVIYHSTGYAYGLYESIANQVIAPPENSTNVYLLYKRSTSGGARFIISPDCILNNEAEYRLLFIGTIIKNSYSGYNLINEYTGDIYDTVTRTATFNAHLISTITETTTSEGIELTENVTGWEVSSGSIEIFQNTSITLPAITGDFSPTIVYKYANLTYDPSTGQYSAYWSDSPASQQDVYTWCRRAVSIGSGVRWLMTAPDFEAGKMIVRDRWQ